MATQETPLQQGEVAVITFIKSWYESNKPAALAKIQTLEGGVEGFIVNGIKNAPKPGGVLGTLFSLAEPELEAWVASLVAKEGPEIVYEFIDNELAYVLADVAK